MIYEWNTLQAWKFLLNLKTMYVSAEIAFIKK